MKNKKRMVAMFLVGLLLMSLMVWGFVNSQERTKQIDQVWDKINGKLGLIGDAADKVWDPTEGWREFNDVYKSSSGTSGSSSGTS
ncbi:hypothetical protein GOV03_05150, partial [Candidatus Woesearchaeota archaeon]|nr:hypothetical protein [Candidatus Woesearchaeota archaeon]